MKEGFRMLTEPLPIEIFVTMRFEERRVARMIENWPIETKTLMRIVIGHFREMGLYTVSSETEMQVIENIIMLLKTSPQIAELVHKAQAAEAARRQNRHSQGV